VSNYGSFSRFMPGLNLIRNHVIKPLLFATEKVVENYMQIPGSSREGSEQNTEQPRDFSR